jgi:hypothetical protein
VLDIKIIAIKDILPVNRVSFVPGFSPRSIRIEGDLLLQADEVIINDIPAPEFIAISNGQLIAQVPDSQVRSSIRSVTVFATKPSPDRRSILRFEVGRTISPIKGLEKLIQYFCKILIQTPGSDSFSPGEGGGLLSLVGRVVSKKDSLSLQAAVVSAVNRSRDQIVSKQSRMQRIPPDERLLRADTQAVGFNPNTSTLSARVSVGAVSGRQAVANLTF